MLRAKITIRPYAFRDDHDVDARAYFRTGDAGAIEDFTGKRARDVVIGILDYRYQVECVEFCWEALCFEVTFAYSDPWEDVLEDIEHVFGSGAADTWMEGDIRLEHDDAYELGLECVNVSRLA